MTKNNSRTIAAVCVLIVLAWVINETHPKTSGSLSQDLAESPEVQDRLNQSISRLVDNPSPFEEEDAALRKQLHDNVDESSAQVQEWKGDHSGVTVFRTAIVKSSKEWQTLWKQHTNYIIPPPPAPDVDFDRWMVVGVFAGTKSSIGYGVTILVVNTVPGKIVVSYQETSPPTGRATPQVPTQPFDLRVIPKTSLPLNFEKIP